MNLSDIAKTADNAKTATTKTVSKTVKPKPKPNIKPNIKPDIKPLTDDEIKEEKTKYTRKIYTPIYEPSAVVPSIKELYDTTKRDELLQEIQKDTELDPEMREFLKSAAERHTSFNFAKIADFYSHMPIKYKLHFENSALVIVDYDKAVRNGFIAFDKEVQESRIDYLENIITAEKMAENKSDVKSKLQLRAEEEYNYLKENEIDDKIEEW